MCQTTQRLDNLQELTNALLPQVHELRIANTICDATTKRQSAALEVARNVDLMIVVGGTHSANTTRLAEICAATGTPTHHIETAAEVRDEWLAHIQRVGVTASASTPDEAIDAVVQEGFSRPADIIVVPFAVAVPPPAREGQGVGPFAVVIAVSPPYKGRGRPAKRGGVGVVAVVVPFAIPPPGTGGGRGWGRSPSPLPTRDRESRAQPGRGRKPFAVVVAFAVAVPPPGTGGQGVG